MLIKCLQELDIRMDKEIYLDNSATTRAYDEVIEYMNDINKNTYGNPSSMHSKGIEAERHVKNARERIARSLKADVKEIYFTSGGTESNNLAIRGYLDANPRAGKHIITTKIEHPSILEVYKHLAENGFSVDYLNVNKDGNIDVQELKEKINEGTSLISIILVNNEIGSIQPIEDIVRVKSSMKKDIALHVDAVQAYGKIGLSPAKSGIDLMTVSSHKIHGPKGIGALYVKKGIKIKPIILGGGQESAIRSGTENVPGICGFGLASEIINNRIDENWQKVSSIKESFIEKLNKYIVDFRVASPAAALPHILNISFGNVKAEVLLHHLEERKIYVSTGSACSSRKNVHSHVLSAIGMNSKEIEGAIRLSFSSFNTLDEVDYTVEAIKDILPRIRIKHGGRK